MKNKIMLGLWRFVINVPSFLWQKQIKAGKRKFEKEFGALSHENRTIHHFTVKELPRSGEPLSPEFISDSLGYTLDIVRQGLDYLEAHMTYLYRNSKGHVTWAYPVTVDHTPHRLTFDTGEMLYAA